MLSGEEKLGWMPYLILWLGLIGGAAVGATLFGIFGIFSLWLPSVLAGIFAGALLFAPKR